MFGITPTMIHNKAPKRNNKIIKKLRNRLWFIQKAECAYCNTLILPGLGTLDHIIPRAHGGSFNIKNLLLTCEKCNKIKKDTSIAEFQLPNKLEIISN